LHLYFIRLVFSTFQIYEFSKNFSKQVFGLLLSNVCDDKYFSKDFLVKSFKIEFQIRLKNDFGAIVDKKAERLHVSTTTTAI